MTVSAGSKPLMLLVLGMHRSGTSLTARMLECLGGVNSRNLVPAAQDNPKGFFEDGDIVRFNQEVLLPRLGREWHDLEGVDWNLLGEADRAQLESHAEDILRANYSTQNAISILKDPRLAILLPFWIPVLSCAGYDPRVVGVVRDPVCVARSLADRNGLPLNHGYMMYLVYWLGIISAAEKLPCYLLSFDELIESPEKTIRKTAACLDLGLPEDFDERLEEFAGSHVDATLRHYRPEEDESSPQPQIAPLAKLLHGLLIGAARRGEGVGQFRQFDAIAKEAIRSLGSLVLDHESLTTLLRTQTETASAIKDRNVSLEHELHAMHTKISKLQHRIESMEGSRSWRLTRPLRAIDERWRNAVGLS